MISSTVEKLAGFFDENAPGWRDVIEIERLDLENPVNCLFQQIGSGYFHLTAELPLGGVYSQMSNRWWRETDVLVQVNWEDNRYLPEWRELLARS